MAKVNVSIPRGTRDFGPETVRKRNYIFETIRSVFELYGFQPLETPAMENLETLMGKYGDEGDKLIFRILNNGLDKAKDKDQLRTGFENVLQGRNSELITERALKYDLTIPFARYVAMNHGSLTFPFKRYQIQPVWRADQPQRGRYREFYQCDADVVGSKSLLNEVELAHIYATVFARLQLPVSIRINSRKLLTALAETCGSADKLIDITIAIDKLDKIGLEKVQEELRVRQLGEAQIDTISRYLAVARKEKDNHAILSALGELLTGTAADEGLADLRWILDRAGEALAGSLVIDPTLARGLNYYTGTIFEIKAVGVNMGSIGGGGRYDDLTGLFGVPGVPGVGISFGVDRIYDVLEELKVFPDAVHTATQVLFFNMGDAESRVAFELMQNLRLRNIRCELYHEAVKFDKQFKYAEKKNIPFVIIVGSKEMEEKTCIVKDIRNGQQQSIAAQKLDEFSFI